MSRVQFGIVVGVKVRAVGKVGSGLESRGSRARVRAVGGVGSGLESRGSRVRVGKRESRIWG